MPPDPTPLQAAARRQREHAQSRARDALRQLDRQGAAISFQAVARHAGVSRQWLYQQPELRKEIERLRATAREGLHQVPTEERATKSSLRQRVHTLLERTVDCGRNSPASGPSSRSRTANGAPVSGPNSHGSSPSPSDSVCSGRWRPRRHHPARRSTPRLRNRGTTPYGGAGTGR